MARDFPGAATNLLSLTNPIGLLDMTGASMTISAWVRLDTVAGVSRPFVAKRNAGGIQYLLRVKTATSGRLSYFIGGTELLSAALLATGAWIHVCVSKAGTGTNTTQMYVNGSLDAQGNMPNPADTTADFNIGADSYEGSYCDGQIQDVALWNVGLTAAEVAALAKGVSPQMVRRANLIAHYAMWGASSAGEIDLSGNGQNVAVVGAVGVGANPAPVGPFVLL
jgi:hypothetical protein